MNESRSLDEGFAANIPQTAADIADALRTGLLGLDANVLLNFYRYSPNARDALVGVLRAAEDRVWVSHQAAREFWRNRCRAIDARNEATDQLRVTFGKQQNAALDSVDTWAKQTAVPGAVKQQVKETLAKGFEQARDLFEAEVTGAGTVAYDATRDTVLAALQELLSAHVGPPLEAAEHAEALAEGTRRAKEGVPPGFRDADKAQAGSTDGASGDYLVWLQSIHEACRRDLPLVIVTGDEKDDWWWKHRSSFLGPRPELVDEFARRSSHPLFMLRPVQLIEHAGVLHVSVPEGVASDVARASSDALEEGWTVEAVTELLSRLDREGWVQADVIRFAATQGGVVEREAVYAIAGYPQKRTLRGFTRPVARMTRQLIAEGSLPVGVEPILSPVYRGSTMEAERFEIPLDVVEILSA